MKRVLSFLWLAFLVQGMANAVNYNHISEDVSNEAIYEFLDEMASERIISINSAIKPYSRQFISERLLEIDAVRDSLLNRRQRSALDFFLKDYCIERGELPSERWGNVVSRDHPSVSFAFLPPAVCYKDSLFRVRMVPLLGVNVEANKNGALYQRYWGAAINCEIGSHFALYASLRDNHLANEVLAKPSYLTTERGGAYKMDNDLRNADFSEMRGGITWSNRWISLGLEKNYVEWGDNLHGSSILDSRAPSFPMITFRLKPCRWFSLDYLHGFLTSNVIDSTDYYIGEDNKKRYRYRNKYIASNMFTFTPVKGLNIGLGNSVVYAERTVKAGYLIPCMFYKSIDHSITMGSENQNSQMFLNISSRNVKHLHLFATLFVDEFKASRIKDSTHNFVSYKAGLSLDNWPLQNLSLRGEFTYTDPITYKHRVRNTTYASSDYSLGHYLGDNATELYCALTYKPFSTFSTTLSFTNARKGNDFSYLEGKSAILTPPLKEIVWKSNTLALDVRYHFLTALHASLRVAYGNVSTAATKGTTLIGYEVEKATSAEVYMNRFTPSFYQGKTVTFSFGLNYYF